MENKISQFIKKNNLIDLNDTIVIALSGGVDSMVLFHCLKRLGYKLVVCHVNHNVRKESYNEYQEIEKLCKKENVPFYGLVLEEIKDKNFHDEARNKRYQFFMDIANKYNTNIIATAHHLDDLIETVLMKITRGSNLLGYSGIKPCVNNNNYKIVRPLLAVSKDEIYEYAHNNCIAYFEDSSNETDHYTRNRFRHHIVPLLKQENPNLYQEFLSFQTQASNAFNFIRKQSLEILSKNKNIINVNEFVKLDKALQFDIISVLLENEQIVQITCKVYAILDMINSNKPNQQISIGNKKIFVKSYDKAYITDDIVSIDYSIKITDYGTYNLPNGDQIILTKNKDFDNSYYINICYNNIVKQPIIVRNRKEGDFIQFNYGKKLVRRHLIDKKIPLKDRDIIPIVTDDLGNIIGIIGIGPKKEMGDYLYWLRREKNE